MGHDWHCFPNKRCQAVIRRLVLIKIQQNKETSDYLNLKLHSARWLCFLNSLLCFSVQLHRKNKKTTTTTKKPKSTGYAKLRCCIIEKMKWACAVCIMTILYDFNGNHCRVFLLFQEQICFCWAVIPPFHLSVWLFLRWDTVDTSYPKMNRETTSTFELGLFIRWNDNCAVRKVVFEDKVEPNLTHFLLNFSGLPMYIRI